MESARKIKFMTYNVWAREDVVVYRRMQAIGGLVRQHKPDVIFFQEVTPHILNIFERLEWWKDYEYGRSHSLDAAAADVDFCLLLSKLPVERFAWHPLFLGSARRYLEARINPGNGMNPIHVATARLDSPALPLEMRCYQRSSQAEQVISSLNKSGDQNVVLGGDMSWDDDVDLPFRLTDGWVDAWTQLRPQSQLDCSWTYDGIWNNENAASFNGYMRSPLNKRSDRFVCKLQDYSLNGIELIGSRGVGLRYRKRKPYDHNFIDVMPSCHRGLVLTIVPNEPARPEDPPAPAGTSPPVGNCRGAMGLFGRPNK